MQKVITITSHTNIVAKGEHFTESEYPQLTQYLEDGYRIVNTIPIVKPSDQSFMYSVVFILENQSI